MDNKEIKLAVNFYPQEYVKEAEEKMKKEFRARIEQEIGSFFKETSRYDGNVMKRTVGPGALLITDWLEKKFDDLKTQERMQKYFDDNFDRIMTEAMEKKIEHVVKKFVFSKEIPTSAQA